MIQQLPMTRNKLTAKFALIGLLLITLSSYFPPFAWAFVGDDYVQFDYIKEVIAHPWLSLALFNPYYLPWYYRPLQLLWFWLLEGAFHFTPHGYYWIELLFHALAVALVYRVARQLKLGAFMAVLAATLFAIHSHWVDVASWLSSIAIVLAGRFFLAGVERVVELFKTAVHPPAPAHPSLLPAHLPQPRRKHFAAAAFAADVGRREIGE